VNFSDNAVGDYGIAFYIEAEKCDAQFLTVVGGEGGDVFSVWMSGNVSLAWSNIVGTEQDDGVVYVHGRSTRAMVDVKGCHFVNVTRNEYFAGQNTAFWYVRDCVFDGPFENAIIYATFEGCQELTDVPTIGLPQMLLRCTAATVMPCGGDDYDGVRIGYTNTSIPPGYLQTCLTVRNSEFLFCRKIGDRDDGGAIYVEASGAVQIADSKFYVCRVSTLMAQGGAVCVTGSAVELMRLCGDSCTALSGLFFYVSTRPEVPVVHDVTLSNSYAVPLGYLGGLRFFAAGYNSMSAEVVTVNFSRPSTRDWGAACSFGAAGTPTVQWCTVNGGTGGSLVDLDSTEGFSIMRVFDSNFVNAESYCVIGLVATGSLGWVERCHFVNVSDDRYFDPGMPFVVVDCWFDGVFPQTGITFFSQHGNRGQANATTLRIPYSNPSCPPAMPSSTPASWGTATVMVTATPTGSGVLPTGSSMLSTRSSSAIASTLRASPTPGVPVSATATPTVTGVLQTGTSSAKASALPASRTRIYSGSATAVVPPATPTRRSMLPTRPSSATASAMPVMPPTPSASEWPVVIPSATAAASGAAKKNEHTAPIIFGTVGGVLLVAIIVVGVLATRREGHLVVHRGGLEESLRHGEALVQVEGGRGSRIMSGPANGEALSDSLFSVGFDSS
jgi:hypothetical protein